MQSDALKGLEIAWVEDPVAAAFMQIQGSGKIVLENKKILRLGFSGSNNQPYASLGQWLINQNQLTYAQASMQGISEWAKKNPSREKEMLNANPRFIFFKIVESSTSLLEGPIGSIGVPLTAGRSIAVDWQSIPRGTPVFLSSTDPQTTKPLQRLVFAQDTGSAIIGGVRADYFWGSGDSAGNSAGKMKQVGRMWAILPKSMYP
jgi:membrane-bound lytic murein transglycosylase A